MDMLRGGWGPGLMGNGQGVVGAGSSYAAETEAIAAAFTTPPTAARKNLIDAAVVALKSAGVWTKLDCLYVLAAADSQAAKINWIAPGTYNLTEVNAPPFTADTGFTGASTKYIDTGFNPSTAPSPKYVLNSASVFGWSLTTGSLPGTGMLGTVSSFVMRLIPNASSLYYGRLNAASDKTVANADGRGLYCIARGNSASFVQYKNGVSVATPADTSAFLVNANILIFTDSSWAGTCSVAGFGADLTAGDNTALYNALRTYLTGVGVP
jgi:hypothetical protein